MKHFELGGRMVAVIDGCMNCKREEVGDTIVIARHVVAATSGKKAGLLLDRIFPNLCDDCLLTLRPLLDRPDGHRGFCLGLVDRWWEDLGCSDCQWHSIDTLRSAWR